MNEQKKIYNEEELLSGIISIVEDCANILLMAERIEDKVEAKEGHANFVTFYDKQVQEKLKEGLLSLCPEAAFIGEEGDEKDDLGEGYAFIVDPIDGTSNFLKGLDCSCISVGLIKDGKRVGGVVFNPYLDELYTALRGRGAFCNGEPIHVSQDPLAESLAAFGTSPYYPELCKESFRLAYEYCQKCIDLRRSGSAAIDLCNVARGRTGLFFELHLSPWDFAAGALIVEEAGGIVLNRDGGELPVGVPSSVFAMNQKICREIFS